MELMQPTEPLVELQPVWEAPELVVADISSTTLNGAFGGLDGPFRGS